MKGPFLDFEKPLVELESQIEDMRAFAGGQGIEILFTGCGIGSHGRYSPLREAHQDETMARNSAAAASTSARSANLM